MHPIENLKTVVLYRNPKPHVRSIHAYFPSVAVLPDGEMLATVVLGEAFEAVNLRTHLFRSIDQGESWQHEGPLHGGTPDRLTSDCARLTALPGGDLAVFMIRHDRADHPDEGLASHETLGLAPTELLLLRSKDRGKTWTGPEPIDPPLVGPCFELCCPITVLRDGRWLIPTQTWQGWNGDCPNGIRMIALVSHDQGRTWPDYLDVMTESTGRVYFWESKVVELSDGRLLATAWAYDDDSKTDRPNQYVISADGGRSWSSPASTGLQGQTLTPLALDDGRVLCVYRRMDRPGLWANLCRLDGNRWVNEAELPLWGHEAAGLTASTQNMAHNFNVLRFGAPCLTRLTDGTVVLAFWCYEDCVSVIRCCTLAIGD
ncbi:MAG: exo-alpha-sialidase [Armatimonadetes bacterium]|nr:exo-alpha-sialidase [Armatimonadota bacterium]